MSNSPKRRLKQSSSPGGMTKVGGVEGGRRREERAAGERRWGRGGKLPPFRNTAEFIYACHAILLAFRYPPSITALMPTAHLEAFSLPLKPRRTWGSTIQTPCSSNTMPRVYLYTERSYAPTMGRTHRVPKKKRMEHVLSVSSERLAFIPAFKGPLMPADIQLSPERNCTVN